MWRVSKSIEVKYFKATVKTMLLTHPHEMHFKNSAVSIVRLQRKKR